MLLKKRLAIVAAVWCLTVVTALAVKLNTPEQCQGSLGPYPAPQAVAAYPDSLTPVLINHVGRHGSRYPASSRSAETLLHALERADSLGTITPLGQQFKLEIATVCIRSFGKWGQLDSLGQAEQRGIARRLAKRYPMLVNNGTVLAQATHSPRAIKSMYAFTHELSGLGRGLNIFTSSGDINSHSLRPYDTSDVYRDFMRGTAWRELYNSYVASHCPTPAKRLLGDGYPATDDELRQLSIVEYYNIANMKAMGMEHNWEPYLTLEEYNQLWSCFNLRQLLCHTSTSVSQVPAAIIDPLIADIVSTTDRALSGQLQAKLIVRFAHAETLMPLLSRLMVPACNFRGTDFSIAGDTWQDFNVVPMAANVQFIIFKSTTGNTYVRLDVNEHPTQLIDGDSRIYVPWQEARSHMLLCTSK